MRKFVFFMALALLATITVMPASFAAGKVVVYSTNQQSQNDMMAAEFEKDTGIKCEIVRDGSGIILKRIRAEKDRPLGDVVMGLAKSLLNGNMDLWQPYKIKDWDAYPADFKDPNGFWTGQMVHVMVFITNTKLVSASDAPKSWNDFLNPKWQDRVAFCNPNNSGAAFTQLTLMLDLWGGGDAAWKKVETVLKHAKITQQSSLVYKGVAQGEFPAGITMEYAGYLYKVGGAPVEVIYPSDGTVAYTEGAAIIKGSKNLDNAKKFMDWASGIEARKKIVSKFMRRPARTDIDFNALVPGMIPLSQVNLLKAYNEDHWSKTRTEVLNKVKDTLLRIK